MRTKKKILMYLLCFVILFIGIERNNFTVNAAENGYAMFPMKYLNVSNGESGHGGRLIIDLAGVDTGRDAFFAPFDGKVIKFFSDANSVIIESTSPVTWANGTIDYVHMWLAHDDDISDLYVGKTFKQGEEIYREGTTGLSTGNHVHMICGQGKYAGLNSTLNSLAKEVSAYKVFFLYEDTIVKSTGGYTWKTLSGAKSNFVETSVAYTFSNTGVTSITNTTARINALLSPIAGSVSEVGFYYGTSTTNMQKVVEGAVNSQVKTVWYDLGTGKWTPALKQGTKYYYQMYVIIGGKTYKSPVDSFTTIGDGVNPTISNVQVTNVTRDGYTVTCQVTDNVGVARVAFPTWTVANDQDDLFADWYNNAAVFSPVSGNTYAYNVKVSDHNYEEGTYITHIYAYDAAGNYSINGEASATINRQIPLESFTLNSGSLTLAINEIRNLYVTSYSPANTTSNKAAAWSSSDTSVALVDSQGNVTGVKAGTATITCTVAGKTQTCQVTVSNSELEGFSGWVTTLPDAVANNKQLYEIQTKTQYRSQTKSEKTTTEANLSGWTLNSQWWGDWVSCGSDVTSNANREVKTEQQYVKTQYSYNHYHNNSTGNASPVQYSGWVYHETGWLDYALTPNGTSNAGGTKYTGSAKLGSCGYTNPWYNQTTRDVYNTLYYYRDRYFNYYKWSDWSGWTDNAVTASGNVNVETRIVYNYRYIGAKISAQPMSQTIKMDETAQFSVKATGKDLAYLWQESSDAGNTWSDCKASGSNTQTLSIKGMEGKDGTYYRCVVKSTAAGNSVTSDVIKLTISDELKILSQPVSNTITLGANAVFVVAVQGNNITYQWQYKERGSSSWNDLELTGATTSSITVGGLEFRNGQQYRCVITDAYGNTVITDSVLLTVEQELQIITQPTDWSVVEGENATFTVEALGIGLSYQWQFKAPNGSLWNNSGLAGAQTSTITVEGKLSRNGQQYRCVVTDESGEQLFSEAGLLSVKELFEITGQPVDRSVDVNEYTTFTVAAEGNDLSYQWQCCKDGSTWFDSSMEGSTTANLRVQALATRDGYLYRCIVTNGAGEELISNAAALTVNTFVITGQPESQSVDVNEQVTFMVVAEGNVLSYQWQCCKDGVTWFNSSMEGATTAKLSVQALASRDGYQYRCVVTNGSGKSLVSDAVTLQVNMFAIMGQPVNQSVSVDEYAAFTVQVEGKGLSYQWQCCKDGSTWFNSSMEGSTTASLRVQALTSRDGYQYRCVVTNGAGKKLVSNAARLTVNKFAIIEQPVNRSVEANEYTSFTVVAEGKDLSYQWQFCRDGANWYDSGMEGSTTASMKVQALTSRDGYQYRCVVTNGAGQKLVSNVASLTVNMFEITSQPVAQRVVVDKYATYTVVAEGSGLSYQWQFCRDGVNWYDSGMEGSTTASMKVQALTSRDGYQYRCVVTDANGNVLVSNAASLTVLDSLVITGQPSDQSVVVDGYATYTVVAEGNGLSYQWQCRREGTDWFNSSMEGATTASMKVQALSSRNGYQYRCVVTDANGAQVVSSVAKLTVM